VERRKVVFRQAGDAAGGQVAGEAELQRDPGPAGTGERERGCQQGGLSSGPPASSSALPAQPVATHLPPSRHCTHVCTQQAHHAVCMCAAKARHKAAPHRASCSSSAASRQHMWPSRSGPHARMAAVSSAAPAWQEGEGAGAQSPGRMVPCREGHLDGRAVSKGAKEDEVEAQAAERPNAGKGYHAAAGRPQPMAAGVGDHSMRSVLSSAPPGFHTSPACTVTRRPCRRASSSAGSQVSHCRGASSPDRCLCFVLCDRMQMQPALLRAAADAGGVGPPAGLPSKPGTADKFLRRWKHRQQGAGRRQGCTPPTWPTLGLPLRSRPTTPLPRSATASRAVSSASSPLCRRSTLSSKRTWMPAAGQHHEQAVASGARGARQGWRAGREAHGSQVQGTSRGACGGAAGAIIYKTPAPPPPPPTPPSPPPPPSQAAVPCMAPLHAGSAPFGLRLSA
jgi:hypothetical protein